MNRMTLGIAGTLACLATALTAQDAVDRFDIAIDAANEAEQSAIITLATTFAMLAPQTSGQRKASRIEFHSGAGLIENGSVTDKLRASIPEGLGQSVGRLTNMRKGCDISRHRFENTDVLMIVHDGEDPQPQDAHRCFVAGLWIYHTGSTQSVSVDNWRVPYARILTSVAAGQPAFAGFDTGDN